VLLKHGLQFQQAKISRKGLPRLSIPSMFVLKGIKEQCHRKAFGLQEAGATGANSLCQGMSNLEGNNV
jgi:hypothetical protein